MAEHFALGAAGQTVPARPSGVIRAGSGDGFARVFQGLAGVPNDSGPLWPAVPAVAEPAADAEDPTDASGTEDGDTDRKAEADGDQGAGRGAESPTEDPRAPNSGAAPCSKETNADTATGPTGRQELAEAPQFGRLDERSGPPPAGSPPGVAVGLRTAPGWNGVPGSAAVYGKTRHAMHAEPFPGVPRASAADPKESAGSAGAMLSRQATVETAAAATDPRALQAAKAGGVARPDGGSGAGTSIDAGEGGGRLTGGRISRDGLAQIGRLQAGDGPAAVAPAGERSAPVSAMPQRADAAVPDGPDPTARGEAQARLESRLPKPVESVGAGLPGSGPLPRPDAPQPSADQRPAVPSMPGLGVAAGNVLAPAAGKSEVFSGSRQPELPFRAGTDTRAPWSVTMTRAIPAASPPAIGLQNLVASAGRTNPDLAVDGPAAGMGPELAEPAPPGLSRAGSPGAPAGSPGSAPIAQHVARQIAVAVTPLPTGSVEISLSPEELGRVRLTVSATDGVVAVALQAERPETGDLMRRHIEILARELRDLGYQQTEFSFGGFGASSGRAGENRGSERHADRGAAAGPERADTATASDVLPSDPTTAGRAGLDLRL